MNKPPVAAELSLTSTSRTQKVIVVLWLSILILIPAIRFGPDLFTAKRFHDDASIFTFVFWNDKNPSLLANDPTVQYIRTSWMPPIYKALVSPVLALFENPLTAMNFLSFLLVIFFSLAVFVCGYRLHGLWAGALAAALLLHSAGAWPSVAGSFPRSFGPPLVAATLAAWMIGRERIAVLIQTASLFLYPPAYVLLTLTAGLRLVFGGMANNFHRKDYFLFVCTQMIVIALFITSVHASPYGFPNTGSNFFSDPHWQGTHIRNNYPFAGPKWELLNSGVVAGLPALIPRRVIHRIHTVYYLLAMISAISILVIRRLRNNSGLFSGIKGLISRSKIRDPLLILVASLSLYVLARLFPLRLYFPNRYLTLAFPLVMSLLGGYFCARLVQAVSKKRQIFRILVISVIGGIAVCLALFEIYRPKYGFNVRIPPDSVPVLTKISTLPESSVILATGETANSIPLISARSVLWNYESYQVHHISYATLMDIRIRKGINCILNTDWEVAKRELMKIPVTHLLYDKQLWEHPEKWEAIPRHSWLLLSPLWEEYSSRLAAQAHRKELLWYHIPQKNLLYDGPRYKLWAVNF